MSFNNFNCNIGNQVIGTMSLSDNSEWRIAFIQQKIDEMQTMINSGNARNNSEILFSATEELRNEISSDAPKIDVIDRSLKIIEGISSFATTASQIRSLLTGLF